MSLDAYDQVPPVLQPGGIIEFASREALAALIGPELSHRRLLCINLGSFPLYVEQRMRVRVSGVSGEVELRGQGVHQQSDLIGLQVECDAAVLAALKGLAGPMALMRVASRPPAAASRPPSEPPAVPVAPEPAASVEITEPPSGAARLEPEESVADLLAEVDQLWVEPTRVQDPWDLGGLLVQQTEPGASVEAQATPPPAPPRPPEHLTFHGGPGLSGFLEMGHGSRQSRSLFRFLGELAREPRPGRIVLHTGGVPLELLVDARGGIVSFTGMAAAAPEQDAQELRAARRRQLAERLVPLGERGHLEVEARAEPAPHRPGEKTVPVLDALLQWLELALAPHGSEPLAQHYHARLFQYPVLRVSETWGPHRLPLDRLQQRFVEEGLPTGRSLQELLTFSPLGRPRTWRMLVLLDALGFLAFEQEPPAAGRAGTKEAMLDALRRRATQGRESHFAALGLHFASHDGEFKLALDRIVEKYGPSSAVAQHSTETRKVGEEIVQQAKAAYAVISDRDRRIAYRETILSSNERRAAVDLLVGQLKLATLRKLPELSHQLADVILELDPRALSEAGIVM